MKNTIKRELDLQKIIEKTQEEIEKEDDSNTWKYAGIEIPGYIKSVQCLDKVNIVDKYGYTTEIFGLVKPYTLEEYQLKYSYKGTDGKLYWKE